MRTTAGPVVLDVPYVQRREHGQWLSPVRELWELEGNHPLTPELEERLSLTATLATSYQAAAELAGCWGSPVADDSTIWHHVQAAGERALLQEQERERAAQVPALREQATRAAARDNGEDFSLLVMLDGWMARERGAQWGLKPSDAMGERACWREQKTAIIMRTEHRAQTQSGRAMVVEKAVVWHQGEWDGLARKLHAEMLRRGSASARETFVVADGGVWIWNLVAERLGTATQVLDFYHASQHLWAVAKALHGEDDERASQWAKPLLHQLRHGGEAGVLKSLEDLGEMLGELGEERRHAVDRERRYFAGHAERLHYAAVQEQGCPVGSGAMESTCAQLQGRFKRTGQFWTTQGKARLMSLELARRNGDWAQLWPVTREQR